MGIRSFVARSPRPRWATSSGSSL
ncbi:unnamed protein product [Linum tenue]|uniref:Uncharacterized protein n=1 Tax=Linum tenue TaxID=586396 RepID=A0AAV0MH25_9ROSI|nr:unnamed protein product [Linum tenue]